MLYAKRINLLYIFKQTLLMCPYLVQTPNDTSIYKTPYYLFTQTYIQNTLKRDPLFEELHKITVISIIQIIYKYRHPLIACVQIKINKKHIHYPNPNTDDSIKHTAIYPRYAAMLFASNDSIFTFK